VQPSGLIFLVIIAIWAAYLLQHWVRRREHLATARSVDRFSDAMRVLERRSPLPESELSLPPPRSYSVSPARPSRSEVVVKRAQSPTPKAQVEPAPAVHSTRLFHAMAGMSARRLRGLSLLASLSFVAVVSPLAAVGVLPWWSAPVVGVLLVVDIAWLRQTALGERSARRAHGRISAADPRRRSATSPARPASSQTPEPARPSERSASAKPVEPVTATPAAGATEATPAAESVGSADSPVEVDLSGWAPVPVPPPTYTLKAKARRPEPARSAGDQPAATQQPSSFDGVVDEGELDGLLNRRHAAGA